MPGLEPLEEWLAGQEQRLQGSLSKAWQSLVTITVPILLSLTPAPLALKVVGTALWVSLLLNLRLWSRVCALQVAARRKLSDDTKPQQQSDSLSDLEHSMLDLMYGIYPDQYTRDQLMEKLDLPRVEVDSTLMSLIHRDPKLVCKPRGGLIRDGQPHPHSWSLSTHGMIYTQKRKSEQGGAQQPLARS